MQYYKHTMALLAKKIEVIINVLLMSENVMADALVNLAKEL